MVDLAMLYDAREKLKGVARVTPVFSVPMINENVYIKSENLQLTGAFKIRGAAYKIASLTPEEASHGVIAASAGNHAQGVALSAARRGIRSVICLPAGAPLSKIQATRSYGGEVVAVEGVYDDACNRAIALSETEGYTFVHPFDDERVIAGQGTIGLEILEQLPEVEAVVVPIGGGGLISGVACAVKLLKPGCKVYGVQAEGAPSMLASQQAHRILGLDSVSTIADGIAVKKPGVLPFEMVSKYVDGIVTVSDDEIATAILTLMEGPKVISEGAGATTVAAMMFHKLPELSGKKVVCVVSGGNIDVSTLSRTITKGLTKTGRITEFTTKVIDKPNQLIRLLQIVSGEGANIVSISHEREDQKSDVSSCAVKMVVETRDQAHRQELLETLALKGYELY